MKRIVVLGGVGLIGSHLCVRLISEGHDVVCIDVRDVAQSPLLEPYYRCHEFRYINHNIIAPFSIECDQIYNLASPCSLKSDVSQAITTLRTNIIGSINALDLAHRNRASVLYASAGDVYGIAEHNSFGALIPQKLSMNSFAESKRAAEAIHYAYRREYGLNCRVARVFSTYGSGCQIEDRRVVVSMIVAALRNENIVIYGNGLQLRTFCWVDDMVDGIVRLMSLPNEDKTSVVNLGASHEISIRDLAKKIISLTGSRSRIIHAEARRDDPRRVMPDLSLAHSTLKWSPKTTLNEGLRRTIEYIEGQLGKVYVAPEVGVKFLGR